MKLMLAQNTAQPPVLNSRRSAGQLPAKMPLPPAAWRFTRPGGRNGRQANPCGFYALKAVFASTLGSPFWTEILEV